LRNTFELMDLPLTVDFGDGHTYASRADIDDSYGAAVGFNWNDRMAGCSGHKDAFFVTKQSSNISL
jgi:hypothetical protein